MNKSEICVWDGDQNAGRGGQVTHGSHGPAVVENREGGGGSCMNLLEGYKQNGPHPVNCLREVTCLHRFLIRLASYYTR